MANASLLHLFITEMTDVSYLWQQESALSLQHCVPEAQNELELGRVARHQTFSSSVLFFMTSCSYLTASIFSKLQANSRMIASHYQRRKISSDFKDMKKKEFLLSFYS